MSENPDPTSPPDEQAAAARPLREVMLVFALSALLTRALSDLAAISALVSEYLFTLVAAVFLLIPYAILTRRGRDLEAHAMTWRGWPRAAGAGLLLALAIAAPFFAGYHLWRTQVLGHQFEFDADHYRQLPVLLEGRPPALDAAAGPAVQIWKEGGRVHLTWSTGQGRHQLDIELDPGPDGLVILDAGRNHAADPLRRRGADPPGIAILSTTTARPALRSASVRLRDADDLSIRVRLDGRPAPGLLRLGPQRLTPEEIGEVDAGGALRLSRGLGWIPMIIAAQLLLVALPEEFFYRGYLQTTLDRAMPRRARLWIFHLSPAILITSALFGLGHFIIDLRPARLAVFFPSLLFGWLRDRTGTITSCVVFHAACNLLVESATHHYL